MAPDNPLQYFQGKRNAQLVQFLEQNENFSRLVMKLIRMVSTVAEEQRVSAAHITYEVAVPRGHERIASKDGMVIAINVRKPTGIIG